ncbi:MAG: hypothetical protein J7641_05785 [Cyanobacteria bacterium SID2]|nr:hypothetical protein [Cyanobacteria bacterium SID2]MBP0002652.1 hypothetical protein [Cyanobacteria bacterium SBC]
MGNLQVELSFDRPLSNSVNCSIEPRKNVFKRWLKEISGWFLTLSVPTAQPPFDLYTNYSLERNIW